MFHLWVACENLEVKSQCYPVMLRLTAICIRLHVIPLEKSGNALREPESMSIEFHCLFCNKLLKTDLNKAGMQCECPHCQQIIIVPEQDNAQSSESDSADLVESEKREELSDSHTFDSRKQKTKAIPKDACPQCLNPMDPNTSVCSSCGLNIKRTSLVFNKNQGQPKTHRHIDANQVLSRTVATFKANWSISLNGSALFLFLWIGLREFNGIVVNLQPGVSTILSIVGLFLQILILVGVHILFLNIATDNNPQLNDLISGGRFIFRYFANQIVLFVLMFLGIFCFVLPGILVAVISTPVGFVLVDQNLPGLLSIKKCLEITSGNRWGLFLLILVALGMIFWGVAALLIGLLVAFPLVNLLFAVAYCEMTNQ